MPFELGALILPLKAELDRRQIEAQGREAASVAGKGFTASGLAAKAFGVAATAAFGIATKGAFELDRAQATLQQRTGASAEEARKLALAINQMSGRNLQSIGEITEAMVGVRTHFGLAGEELERVTQTFLTFAQATGQDAAQATHAFDRILGGFGLTAADATGIMDQLVVSYHRFGGSVEDNQAALGEMAPALQAMNAGVDEGIALLNLFAQTGVNASDASALLSRAVKSLKPGQDLNDLVAQLGAIEDPTLRAQRAIEIFGRSGAKIANSIKPGTTSLAEFTVRADEVEGATERAADASLTMTDKIKLAFKGLGATITGVLGQNGPLFTGLASLVSLGSTLGLDRVLRRMATSGALRAAATMAGGAVGAVFGAAMFVAEKLASLAVGAIAAIPGGRGVVDAARNAGAAVGGTFAIGWAGALAGGALALPAIGFELIKNLINEALTGLAGIKEGWDRVMGEIRGEAPAQLDAALVQPLYEANARAKAVAEQGGQETGRTFASSWADATREGFLGTTPATLVTATDAFETALLTPMRTATEKAKSTALANAVQLPLAFARGISADEGRTAVEKSWADLLGLIKDSKSVTAQTAELIGQLTGEKLALALNDKDPRVREAARNHRDLVIEQLENLNVRAGTITPKAAAAIEAGLKSKDPEIAAWAGRQYATIAKSTPSPDTMAGWASAAMQAYADAIARKEEAIRISTAKALAGMTRQMQTASPPKEGPLKDIVTWAEKTGLLWVEGFVRTLGSAPAKIKDVLGWVKAEFDRFVLRYPGIGGLLGSFTPEGQRAELRAEIKRLEKELAETADPARREAIYREIAGAMIRIEDLSGDIATAQERQLEAWRKEILRLDRALLTESDPKKRQQMIDEIAELYKRIIEATAKATAAELAEEAKRAGGGGTGGGGGPYTSFQDAFTRGGVAAAEQWLRDHPADNPQGQINAASSGGRYVERSPGVWDWVPDATAAGSPASAAAPDPMAAQPGNELYLNNGMVNPNNPYQNASQAQTNVTIVVNNPEPEPYPDSAERNLRFVASGVFG